MTVPTTVPEPTGLAAAVRRRPSFVPRTCPPPPAPTPVPPQRPPTTPDPITAEPVDSEPADPQPPGPAPTAPEAVGPAPVGPEAVGPEAVGPAPDGPEAVGPAPDGPEVAGPAPDGPEAVGLELVGSGPSVSARPSGPVRELSAAQARGLALEAWREAKLTSPSGRAHFLGTVDSWLERGWSVAFYGTGSRVMLYSCGAEGAWLPAFPPPRRLSLPRGVGRLAGVYTGAPLFPGDKGDYRVPGVAEPDGGPSTAELVLGVHGDDLHVMDREEAEAAVAHLEAAFSARTYGEARELGLDVENRRRCLDYYIELVCRAHEDVDEEFLRTRSTQDLWNAVRPADDQPFDVTEHPCFGESDWRPAPTVRGPWADAEFREVFGPVDRDWPTGREHIAAEHANDVLAHLRDRGWSVARDDALFAAFWPDA